MRIDAHMHINFRNISSRNIIDYLDKHKYDCCWLMTREDIHPENGNIESLSIENIYETYLRYPERIVPMYAPDPRCDDAPEKLLAWCSRGVKGCAELKTTVNGRLGKLKKLLDAAHHVKMPVVLHMENRPEVLEGTRSDSTLDIMLLKLMQTSRFKGLPKKIINLISEVYEPLAQWKKRRTVFPGYKLDFASLRIVLKEYPMIKFIAHGPLFWRHISTDGEKNTCIRQEGTIKKEGPACSFLRHYPNLYADISAPSGFYALNRDHAFSRRFLSEFSHKLLFGTDNYPMGHEDLLKSLRLGPKAMRRLMGTNAQQILMQ